MEDEDNSQGRRQFTTPEQKRVLEFVYQVNPRPNKKLQTYLSNTLEMSFKRVRVWFQNKRTREKMLKEPIIRSCDEIINLLTNKLATTEGLSNLPANNFVFHHLSSEGTKGAQSQGDGEQQPAEKVKPEPSETVNQSASVKNIKNGPSSSLNCNPPSPMTLLSDNLQENLTLATQEPDSPKSDRYFAITKKNTINKVVSPFNSIGANFNGMDKKNSKLSANTPHKTPELRSIKPKPINIANIINTTGNILDQDNGEDRDELNDTTIDSSACILHNLTKISNNNNDNSFTRTPSKEKLANFDSIGKIINSNNNNNNIININNNSNSSHQMGTSPKPPVDANNPLYSILMTIEMENLSDDEIGYNSDEVHSNEEEEEPHTSIHLVDDVNNNKPNINDAELAKKSPLISAILYENEEKVSEILKTKPDLSSTHNSLALHCAAKRGNAKIVKLLIVSGASLSSRDHLFYTPLHHACIHNHLEVISL